MTQAASETPELHQQLSHQHSFRSEPVLWRDIEALAGSDLENSGRRYGAWANNLNQVAGLPIEFVLPRIEVTYKDEMPRSMLAAEDRFRENPQMVDRILEQQWGYYFYLGGGKSTQDKSPAVKDRNRASSQLRMQMINDVIERMFGDSFAQASVLDYACNWGGMAIDMAHRGCASVEAFDFKQDNIKKARMLKRYLGINNARFAVEDAYNLPAKYRKGFDIVLNLGLLYHVTDPVRLVQNTFDVTRKVAVFDSLCHKEPFPGYVQAHISEEGIKRSGMGAQQLELHPTYRGMVELIRFAGFKHLVEVAPIIGPEYPEREKEHYFVGHRRTIIAFK